MNSIVVEVDGNKYLVRYQVLKSVVSRKHTTKEGKVITRNELHPNSVVVYLYQINEFSNNYLAGLHLVKHKEIKNEIALNYLTYLGRGLSKCSEKDKFDKKIGVAAAIYNLLKDIDASLAHSFLLQLSKPSIKL